MIVNGYYDPEQAFFIVDFSDDPTFTLTSAEATLKETWAMFDYGVCAVALNGGHLRFHRLGIPLSQVGEPDETNLANWISKLSQSTKNMENEIALHAPVRDPDSLTLRQLHLASKALTLYRDELVGSCMQSFRSANGGN